MSQRPLGAWWLLAAGFVGGLIYIGSGHLLRGGYVIAGALVLSAVLRLVLPTAAAGGLAVRSKATDVVVMLALGVAVLTIVNVVDLSPL